MSELVGGGQGDGVVASDFVLNIPEMKAMSGPPRCYPSILVFSFKGTPMYG